MCSVEGVVGSSAGDGAAPSYGRAAPLLLLLYKTKAKVLLISLLKRNLDLPS
jgi:hypothetical protein